MSEVGPSGVQITNYKYKIHIFLISVLYRYKTGKKDKIHDLRQSVCMGVDELGGEGKRDENV